MYLGVGLSSLSVLLDEASGWRAAIRYIGLICLCFAFSLFLLVEPLRNKANEELVARNPSVVVEPTIANSAEL
jgi:predicted MFS family arabinose efflux permease